MFTNEAPRGRRARSYRLRLHLDNVIQHGLSTRIQHGLRSKGHDKPRPLKEAQTGISVAQADLVSFTGLSRFQHRWWAGLGMDVPAAHGWWRRRRRGCWRCRVCLLCIHQRRRPGQEPIDSQHKGSLMTDSAPQTYRTFSVEDSNNLQGHFESRRRSHGVPPLLHGGRNSQRTSETAESCRRVASGTNRREERV